MRDLALDDAGLLARCREDALRSGGPGGQHANKTASAVRLVHLATGETVVTQDHRERARNRADALRRLRLRLAASVRGEADPAWLAPWLRGGRLGIGAQAEAYPRVAACLLDALAAHAGNPAPAAAALGLSTSQLIKGLCADPAIRAAAERIRAGHGLGRLHA